MRYNDSSASAQSLLQRPAFQMDFLCRHVTAKKKKSYIALFSQLHSHPVCFSHLNPLWAGGRLAVGARLLWMLAYMLNKAVAADSGWCRILSFFFFLLRPAANRHWCIASATCKKKKKSFCKAVSLQMPFWRGSKQQPQTHMHRYTLFTPPAPIHPFPLFLIYFPQCHPWLA